MDSAPILLPSPRKSPFHQPYQRELQLDHTSSDEDPYSYDLSPDEAVFDNDSQEDSQESHSPHTSDDDLISEFPTDGGSRAPSTIYTPHKRRSPFRHPSSVRNLQLDTTPPHLTSPSKSFRLSTSPHTRNSTPRSAYSTHSRPRSTRSSPSKKEKVKKLKTERPLVLLHFTLLPLDSQYSQSVLESVLPASKLVDFKLLKEKLGQNVVQERGVLIPHPRDDYELLEERLLEALDLEQGTLTRDGHFILPEERGASRASRSVASTRSDQDEDIQEEQIEDEERTEMGDHEPTHLCEDCGRHIQTVGSERRWDIKIYAANGLMREGAWGAAWHEMERVDVEIHPFIGDEAKRELEIRVEEIEMLRQAEQRESAARQLEEATTQRAIEAVGEPTSTPERLSGLDAKRMREIYGEHAAFESSAKDMTDRISPSTRASSSELPLSMLLINYGRLLLQDRRNVAIGFLSVIAVLLAIIAGQSKHSPTRSIEGSAVLSQLSQTLVPAHQASHASQAVVSLVDDTVPSFTGQKSTVSAITKAIDQEKSPSSVEAYTQAPSPQQNNVRIHDGEISATANIDSVVPSPLSVQGSTFSASAAESVVSQPLSHAEVFTPPASQVVEAEEHTDKGVDSDKVDFALETEREDPTRSLESEMARWEDAMANESRPGVASAENTGEVTDDLDLEEES